MTHVRIGFTIVGVLALVAAAAAQQRPDFSGRWVVVSPAEGAGQEQRVEQTETTLTLSHGAEGDDHRMAYRLDGSESRNVITSHGSDLVTLSRCTWKGGALTIQSSTTYPDGRRLEQTMVWSLDEKGQLVIDGSESMSGRPPEKMRVVHRRRS